MINPKEFRIGNLVNHYHPGRKMIHMIYPTVGTVTRIDKNDITIDHGIPGKQYRAEPLPTTLEILPKLGFVESTLSAKCPIYYFVDKGFVIIKLSDGFRLDSHCFRVYLPYVHQLQNLFFALTGDELKFTPCS